MPLPARNTGEGAVFSKHGQTEALQWLQHQVHAGKGTNPTHMLKLEACSFAGSLVSSSELL